MLLCANGRLCFRVGFWADSGDAYCHGMHAKLPLQPPGTTIDCWVSLTELRHLDPCWFQKTDVPLVGQMPPCTLHICTKYLQNSWLCESNLKHEAFGAPKQESLSANRRRTSHVLIFSILVVQHMLQVAVLGRGNTVSTSIQLQTVGTKYQMEPWEIALAPILLG